MKISKHVHSCLLVEEQKRVVLIDPGNYTYEERALDLSAIRKLDYLLITHEHPDHMSLPLIKEILKKFPSVAVISNASVAKILKRELRCDVSIHGNSDIEVHDAPHEKPLSTPPKNSLFKIFKRLVHPGDSLSYEIATDILAMPIQAPWAGTVACLDKAIAVKPKIVIPIHDWHWKDTARLWYYKRASEYLRDHKIVFKSIETGQVIEI